MRRTYDIPAIHCTSCAAVLEETLKDVPGVLNVQVDFDHRRVIVDYHEGDEEAEPALLYCLAEEGYPVGPR